MRKLEKNEIPLQFFEIPEPPKELWIEGELPKEDTIYLTIVGSRKNTRYGEEACRTIIAGLAGYPITIVSGLAIGIDTIAHESAIKAGLTTLSFPGSGLGNTVLYPRQNWQLANEIIESGGALVSEFTPDTKSAIWTFPRRNRLMAALSHAVLIIEAEEKSGTLITARLALDYNKDVYVVPGSIFSQNSHGTNRLIREGAHPICSSLDLLLALGFDPGQDSLEDTEHPATLEGAELLVYESLHAGSLEKETLSKITKLDVRTLNIILSTLEIENLIRVTGETVEKI